MSGGLARPSRLATAYRSFVPPTTTDISAFVWTSTLLTALLVGVVPVLSLSTGVDPLVLVVAASVGYVLVVFLTRTGFEGLCSAVVVLSTFDVGMTLVQGPGPIPVSSLDLMAVDVAIVPLLFVFLASFRARGSFRRPTLTAETIAAAALCGFLGWAILSGLVANGVSDTAPLLDAVQYGRYGLLFVLGALIVRATNPWCVLYPLLIAIGGNLAVALAQVVNRGGFGLGTLGETPTIILGTFAFAGFEVPFGSYAGGFVGHSRELTLILLVFVPLVIAVTSGRSWPARIAGVATVGAAVLVVRTADTDAGWAALLLVGALLAVVLGYVRLRERYPTAATGLLAGGLASVLLAVGLALAAIVRPSADGVPSVPLFDTRTLAIRVEQYEAAFEIARTYPLFGLGSGNFYLMADAFGFAGLRGVHGIVFSYLATAGFVGAGAYVLGVLAVLAIAIRRFAGAADDERLLWGALVCGMVGFHAYSLWDLAHLWDAALSVLWVSMGVVVGAGSKDAGRGRGTAPSR